MNHNYTGVLKTKKYQAQLKEVFKNLQGKSIVLYGAGEFLDSLTENKDLENKLNIKGVSDLKFETSPFNEKYKKYDVIKPSKLKECNADTILLTTAFPEKIMNSLKKNKYKHIKEIVPLVKNVCPLFKYDISFIKNENNKIYYHLNEYGIDIVCDEYFGIVEEVFFWKIYDLKNKFKYTNYSLFDIGMNRAYTDMYFSLDPRCKKCYGFEPFKETYQFALENLSLNPSLKSKIEPFNFGLSDKNTTQDVYFLPHRDGISSVNYDFIKNYAPEELDKLTVTKVQLRKSSEVISDLLNKDSSEQKILKLDAEGAEYSVLPDLYSKDLLKNFNIIVGDMHVLNSKDETKALFDYMYKSGFKKYELNEHEKTMDYIFYKDIELA